MRSILFEEPGYILARVDVRGGVYLACAREPGDPGTATVWPDVAGLLRHTAEKRAQSGERVLVFRTTGGRSMLERLEEGPLAAREAAAAAIEIATTLRSLHLRGIVLGYLGPESLFIAPDGRVQILGDLRGVPDSPFAAPEASGGRPMDPRSDVFALGTLLTRLLAGGDGHGHVVEAWNDMDPGLKSLVERMVPDEPSERYSNMAEVLTGLRSLPFTAPPALDSPEAGRTAVRPDQEAPGASRRRRHSSRRLGLVPMILIAACALAAALFVLLSPTPGNSGEASTDDLEGAGPDTVETVPDTGAAPVDTVPAETASVTGTVLWVSNCTGTSGAASGFRSGPARDYPLVYTSTGASRPSSLLLVRRAGIGMGSEGMPHLGLAEELSSGGGGLTIVPVDMTVLLGEDLSYPGTVPGVFLEPLDPVDTVFVDVVNQGLQYTLEGLGPAAWLAGRIDGASVSLGGEEHLVSVVDIRDGDRIPNEETGIPALLDRTTFLYRDDSGAMPELEGRVRQMLQAVPDEVTGPPDGVPVPDIWVLLGRNDMSGQ